MAKKIYTIKESTLNNLADSVREISEIDKKLSISQMQEELNKVPEKIASTEMQGEKKLLKEISQRVYTNDRHIEGDAGTVEIQCDIKPSKYNSNSIIVTINETNGNCLYRDYVVLKKNNNLDFIKTEEDMWNHRYYFSEGFCKKADIEIPTWEIISALEKMGYTITK